MAHKGHFHGNCHSKARCFRPLAKQCRHAPYSTALCFRTFNRSDYRSTGKFDGDDWRIFAQTHIAVAEEQQLKQKIYDVVALGNLCVDIVVPYEELPPIEEVKRPELLESLTQESVDGDKGNWEAGAQSNFMIAAGRLGLKVASAANIGQDVYGQFLTDILKREGVQTITPLSPKNFKKYIDQTLLCFVLVDPQGRHHFCSRYDFGPWPLLPGVQSLSQDVQQTLSQTEAIFINGFIFDEIPGRIVLAAVESGRKSGAATFFDPGPRAWTLIPGDRKSLLNALLDLSDVVLMTQEEAEAVTGLSDAEKAAQKILNREGAMTQWCVIKLGAQGAMICTKSPAQTIRQPAIQVSVADTVGCGDSFAAAIVLGFIQRQPLQAVLALANAVGAATATRIGAGRNVANSSKVHTLLSQQASSPQDKGKDYEQWAEIVSAEELSSSVKEDIIEAEKQISASSNGAGLQKSFSQAISILEESLKQNQTS